VPDVSLVIPTMNEIGTICDCIQMARKVFDEMGLHGEVIVADSSDDGTFEAARACGAEVFRPSKLGYGNAYLEGFSHAKGRYVVIMDGDLTYDPKEMKGFLELLLDGKWDMVMGTRLKGRIEPGAMPTLHRYVGNPALAGILNSLFDTKISDAHCGMRAITRESLDKLSLRTGGMELASEMVIEAASKGLRITEVPITYHPRRGQSKLSSFSDGWRHLRFMMLYRPVPFLMGPGLLALAVGLALAMGISLRAGAEARMHTLILGSLLLIAGYQMLLAGLYFSAFGVAYGISGGSRIIKKLMSYHSLEKELILGLGFLALGVVLGIKVILSWSASGFGSLYEIQAAMMAMILFILGIQTTFSGMFISLLLLKNGDGGL
jgi:glycosyltransferase involved in cell wall biosynthesis